MTVRPLSIIDSSRINAAIEWNRMTLGLPARLPSVGVLASINSAEVQTLTPLIGCLIMFDWPHELAQYTRKHHVGE